MTEPEKCPRCESTDLTFLSLSSPHGDADQVVCEECDHRWGDGFPDEAGRPLPDGFGDCRECDATGEAFPSGRACRPCGGRGIVQTALLG